MPEQQNPTAGEEPQQPSIEDLLLSKLPSRQPGASLDGEKPKRSAAFRQSKPPHPQSRGCWPKDGTPIKKATNAEVLDRIYKVANMLAMRLYHPYQIKRLLKKEYGTSGRHAEEYISRTARTIWLALASPSKITFPKRSRSTKMCSATQISVATPRRTALVPRPRSGKKGKCSGSTSRPRSPQPPRTASRTAFTPQQLY